MSCSLKLCTWWADWAAITMDYNTYTQNNTVLMELMITHTSINCLPFKQSTMWPAGTVISTAHTRAPNMNLLSCTTNNMTGKLSHSH